MLGGSNSDLFGEKGRGRRGRCGGREAGSVTENSQHRKGKQSDKSRFTDSTSFIKPAHESHCAEQKAMMIKLGTFVL